MTDFAPTLLLLLSSFLGVSTYPTGKSDWRTIEPWHQAAEVTQSAYEIPVTKLGCTPDAALQFPSIIHAAHRIYLDGRLVSHYGDPTMQFNLTFYGSPKIHCTQIMHGSTLTWKVYNNTQYFARVPKWPQLVDGESYLEKNDIFHLIGIGSLFLVSFYFAVNGRSRWMRRQKLTLAAVAAFLAFFLVLSISGHLGLSLPVTTAHKIADVSLASAILLFAYLFYEYSLLPKKLLGSAIVILTGCVVAMVAARTGDEVQLSTTVAFLPLTVISSAILIGQIWSSIKQRTWSQVESIVAMTLFNIASTSDVLFTLGLHDTVILFPFGAIGCVYFTSLTILRQTESMYRDREYLRHNLALEVAMKTEKLEHALKDLKATQGELVQSAKMASIGTLSAGIAHEINNSLNYVKGALQPLERLVLSSKIETEREAVVKKLVDAMKQGVQLTLEIVESLRSYSGINQAPYKEVLIKEVLTSCLTILRNYWKDRYQLNIEVDPSLTLYCNSPGVHQIFLNLISNAIDASEVGTEITVSAVRQEDNVIVKIKDQGSGIPPEVADRIFESFFTTKDSGKGTGLGLFIVKKEMERHRGKIEVNSVQQRGTEFVLTFPNEKVLCDVVMEKAS